MLFVIISKFLTIEMQFGSDLAQIFPFLDGNNLWYYFEVYLIK